VSAAAVPDEVAKSEADARAATETRDAAKSLLESREQLYKEGALARRLVDEARVGYAQAAAQYDTAQKHLESLHRVARHEEVKGAEAQMQSAKGKYEAAEAQLSYSEIRSPISGVVAERPIFRGEMANPGSPLKTVMDISSVIARINLPQAQAAHVKVGQSARIVSTDGSVEANGTVTVVSPAVDPQGTTVEIWVRAANPGECLRPGTTVHVTIMAETTAKAAVVPVAALLPAQAGGSAVMVVGADSIAHEHKVELGVRDGDRVQVLSGVAPGDKVVVAGGVGLQDGAKVRLQKPGETEKQAAAHE
jgi:RND family efflux transporter MFP subunit